MKHAGVGGRARMLEQGGEQQRLASSHAAQLRGEGDGSTRKGARGAAEHATHAGQQSVHIAERAQGAGRGCGQAQRASCTEAAIEKNVTTFCRGELGRVREQQRRHAGQQSVHAAECAQVAGRGSVPGAGMSVVLVGRPRSLGNVR
eukprot:CAMPEP_0180136806 /NCGR_PEP_ID=MMETSP0986-20121125/11767_1 /TAXON_ID=697907 /ORGANISM="non described non described, Strain CCMP2293" /LENGTH=145 /DNA_ID=CAMNT_0022078009 /DNA_START=350 /DNA_END=783 /DNA_ORIENTATION=+